MEAGIARFSLDLLDWGGDLDDGITADRDEHTEDDQHITVTFPLTGALEEVGEAFFRIEEE